MTTTPSDPALNGPWVTEPGVPAPGLPSGLPLGLPSPRAGRGRMVALVAGLLGIVGVATLGAAYAYQRVGGGGPQPESVMPSTVAAFVKVDLDPSGSQKLDAIRFALKFPQDKMSLREDSDLRQVVVKGLQSSGLLKGVDYQRDVAPWLGNRVGVGLVPSVSGTSTAEPTPVIALAVTDRDAATSHLPAIAASLHGECKVLDAYAVCTKDGGDLSAVVTATARGTLEKSAAFAGDMASLGDNGIAAAWVDASRLPRSTGSMLPLSGFGLPTSVVSSGAMPSSGAPAAAGRVAVALRFDGPNLELVGHSRGGAIRLAAASATDSGVTRLPTDTLAAFGVANAGQQFTAAWPQFEQGLKSALGAESYADTMAMVQDSIGISVPGDVAKALGSQAAVAFAGMGADQSDPKIAIVTNGDRAVLHKLVDATSSGTDSAALTLASAGDRSVLAISPDYADEVAKGSGLGDTESFRNAVPDATGSTVVAYVNITGILAAFKDEIPAENAKGLKPLSAVGFSVRATGGDADFRLRLTTR